MADYVINGHMLILSYERNQSNIFASGDNVSGCLPRLASQGIFFRSRIPWVKCVVVPTSPDHTQLMEGLVLQHSLHKVHITDGGSTRHRSIRNGIRALPSVCGEADVVVIHDGVRPFIDEETLVKVTLAAHQFGASGATRPLVSTILHPDPNGFLHSSLDRNQHVASEMPQAFTISVIRSAYEQCSEYDLDYGTECLQLALKYCNVRAKLVPGSELLWKVTYKKDMIAAERTLRELNNVVHSYGASPKLSTKFEEHLSLLSLKISICADVDEISTLKHASSGAVVTFLGANSLEACSDVHTRLMTNTPLCSSLAENAGLVLFAQLRPAENTADHSEEFIQLSRCIWKLAKASSLTTVAVFQAEGSSEHEMLTFISRLLLERNSAMSGQTFIVGHL